MHGPHDDAQPVFDSFDDDGMNEAFSFALDDENAQLIVDWIAPYHCSPLAKWTSPSQSSIG